MATDNTGTETVQEERSFLEKRRYKIAYRCSDCGHEWSRVTTNLGGKDPPCPARDCAVKTETARLAREVANLTRMLEEARAPATVGANMVVKAVDETARIVMEDHHMTNLRDNVREGESVAPKLPGAQQAAADGFFGGKHVADVNGVNRRQMDRLGRRAMGGAFKSMALNPGNVLPGKSGEPILRSVRTTT